MYINNYLLEILKNLELKFLNYMSVRVQANFLFLKKIISHLDFLIKGLKIIPKINCRIKICKYSIKSKISIKIQFTYANKFFILQPNYLYLLRVYILFGIIKRKLYIHYISNT